MSRSKDISGQNGKPVFQGKVPLIGQQQPHPGLPVSRVDDDVLPEDFIPVQDSVIIRKINRVEKIGAIVMPEYGEDTVMWGEVVAVGPGRISDVNGRFLKPQVEKGDIVVIPVFAQLPPTVLRCKTEELLMFRDHEIRCKVRRGIMSNQHPEIATE